MLVTSFGRWVVLLFTLTACGAESKKLYGETGVEKGEAPEIRTSAGPGDTSAETFETPGSEGALAFGPPSEAARQRGVAHDVRLLGSAIVIGAAGHPGAALLQGTSAARHARPDAAVQLLGPGEASIDRGWAVERLLNSEAGLQQSWEFARRPETQVMQIDVPIADAQYVGSGARGLYFRLHGGQILTYSHATWIDASQRRSPVRAEYDRGRIRMVVSEQVLDSSSYPAVLDPTLGVEYNPSGDELTHVPGDELMPRIVAGDDSRLIVWSDSREGTDKASRVQGLLLSESGAATVGDTGFNIGRGRLTGTQVRASVAYSAGTYLVAWASYDSVFCARVDEEGVVLDDPPLTLIEEGSFTDATVAAADGEFLVAWTSSTEDNTGVLASIVSSGGAAGEPVWLTQDTVKPRYPEAVWSGEQYWIVYQDVGDDDDDIFVLRADATAQPVDDVPIVVTDKVADQHNPDIALAAPNYGVIVWSDAQTAAVHAVSLDNSSGTPSFSADERLSAGSAEHQPRLLYYDDSYHIAWLTNQPGEPTPEVAAFAVPERLTGSLLGAGAAAAVDIAAGPGGIQGVWSVENELTNGYDVYLSSFVGGEPEPVVLAAPVQLDPKIANNSSRSLAVWRTPTPFGDELYAARINGLGEFEDAPIGLVGASELELVGAYSNGTDFFALWHEEGISSGRDAWKLMGAWISNAGAVTAPSEMRGFAGIYKEAADVWVDYSTAVSQLTVTFVDGDVIYNAAILDNGHRGNSHFLYEADSVDGSTDLRATSEFVYYRDAAGTFYRILQTDDIGGGSGGALDLPASATSYDLLDDSNGHVIVYHDAATQGISVVRYGFGDAPSWTLADFASSEDPYARPQVAAAPDGYFVVWASDAQLVGRRISEAGQLIDAVDVPIAADYGSERLGDMVTDFADRSFVVYSRYVPDPGVDSRRIGSRVLDWRYNDGAELGEACETGFGCDSGYCVDGVCCDSPCSGPEARCAACSVSAGAEQDGTCTLFAADTECRASTGECDVAERCTGADAVCPNDEFAAFGAGCGAGVRGPCDRGDICPGDGPECWSQGLLEAGATCRDADGLCDAQDVCDGMSPECVDTFLGAETPCRTSRGDCDIAETCDGKSRECPADEVAPSTRECRHASNECDTSEFCTGTGYCAVDEVEPDGTQCSGGSDTEGECLAGVCTARDASDESPTEGRPTDTESETTTIGPHSDALDGGAPRATEAGDVDEDQDSKADDESIVAPEEGCSCRVPGRRSSDDAMWLGAGLALVFVVRRRRVNLQRCTVQK